VGATEWAIVFLVVGARLLLPLTIPYFPLVGIVACLILDAIDQTIFQQFPAIPLDGYQSYDKALDIFYLTVAYLSTFRNWDNDIAFRMVQFLFYYRLVGVVAFELTQVRALLFIFPNTFEYFFIFYEAVRLRWDTMRMGKWTVIVATALIWVFIKLPQEWWIHIAQNDMTDFIKEELFGAALEDSWAAALANRPLVLVAIVAVFAVIGLAGYWIVTRKAPAGDHGPRLKADPLPAALRGAELYRIVRARARIFDWALVEKVALTALVAIIFASMLTGLETGSLRLIVSVALYVVLNAGVSHWLARRGRSWDTVAVEFAVMAVVNLGIVAVVRVFGRTLGIIDRPLALGLTLFFVLLLTLIVVLFDRYGTVREAKRLGRDAAEAARA